MELIIADSSLLTFYWIIVLLGCGRATASKFEPLDDSKTYCIRHSLGKAKVKKSECFVCAVEDSMNDQQALIQQRKLIDIHVSNWGKQRKPVPGDGHCILHAFSLGLREIEDHSDNKVTSLLPKIREELLGDIDFYSLFVGDVDFVAELDSYIISNKYNSCVVDLMLHVCVLVFSVLEGQVRTLLIPPATPRGTIYLCKIGEHYDAVLDKEAASRLKIEESEADHVQLQYVNEEEMRVAVGPSRYENFSLRKEKAKSKLPRRKAMLTRHINVAESLLKSHGSRRKLRELAGKIEEALRELERVREEYESFLELEGLQEHLELTEKAIERANLCLESIEISLNERENEPPSEASSEYAPSLQFEAASGQSSPSRASESERRARVMDLQMEQAKKEAQRRLKEERKRAENLEQERQLQEHRRIRELEYEVERLRLEAQLVIPDKIKGDPEDIENRLRDFEDVEIETVYRDIKPKVKDSVGGDNNHDDSLRVPLQNVKLPPPIKSSRLNKQSPKSDQAYCDTEERLDVSWIKEISAKQSLTNSAGKVEVLAFFKSIPRLELPRFSGDPLEWPQFVSLFKCLIHDQPLTDTQRMTYLQRALTGDAKKAVGGMLNHGHLFKAALTELEEQFGNKEIVAGAFMKTVLDHPIVVEGDIAQLRSFYNTLHNAVATLKGLGYSHDLMSSTNTRAVLQKLPEPLKEKWGERKIEMQPAIPTLTDLDEWLRARLRAKTTVCEPLPSFGKPSRGGRARFSRPPRKEERHGDSIR
ncbi:hypothetical protein ACROYT_G013226 [Oculina patagonica]